MLYEIDFLPVGNGESSGDAMCMRFSEDSGETWQIGVIDGGTQESGEALCDHIRKYYQTEVVDFLICSHPHQDHTSGLAKVIESMDVQKVLMHCPWNYVEYIYDRVADGRVTKENLRQRLKDGHASAYKVYELAEEKGIPVFEAFSECVDHGVSGLSIAGPSEEFYLEQVVNFRSVAEITEDAKSESSRRSLGDFIKKIVKMISESWDAEKLLEPEAGATPSENNSSIISFFDFDGAKVLLTADAGVEALDKAANHIESLGHSLQDFKLFQVPHHGSRRNVGPSVLDRLIGTTVAEGSTPHFTAMVSASKDENSKHPNKRVVNALIRRGAKVVATQGSSLRHGTSEFPPREGWGPVDPLPFSYQVEEVENG